MFWKKALSIVKEFKSQREKERDGEREREREKEKRREDGKREGRRMVTLLREGGYCGNTVNSLC